MKILIAENCPIIRKSLQEQLATWGYEIDLALTGIEIVEYVWKKGVKYDLCLIDVNMPKMSGIEAIKTIRQGAYYLPILACSNDPDYKVRCLEVGANAFLLKPLANAELKKKLEEYAVKQIVLYLDGASLSLYKVGPANSEELNELMILEKKGLVKFRVVDVSSGFLTDKHVQQKLLQEFSKDNMVFTEVFDRTRQWHKIVQIHASQIWLRKWSLTPAQFQQLVQEEDEMLKKYEKT